MTKQTTVRLPSDVAAEAEAVARTTGSSVNQLIINAVHAEINRVGGDADLQSRVKRLAERDRQILDRLAQ